MEQTIKRMFRYFTRAAVLFIAEYMKRQPREGFGQYTNAGVNRCGLHRRPLVYCFAAVCAAKKERETIADFILRFVAGME